MDVLILLGPGGSGKSTMLGSIMLLLIAGGEKIAIVAPTNVAAKNILMRTAQQEKNHRLLIRVWAPRLEEEAIMPYNPSDPNSLAEVREESFSRPRKLGTTTINSSMGPPGAWLSPNIE